MADLEKVIQLDENTEYPDGYNVVEIEGTGDEGGLQVFPNMSLNIYPDVILSDGEQIAQVVLTVADPGDPDFFEVEHFIEKVTTQDFNKLSVSNEIYRITGDSDLNIPRIPYPITTADGIAMWNTPLTVQEEADFQEWRIAFGIQMNVPDLATNNLHLAAYDLRGFWKYESWAGMVPGDHYPDTYKKPNHVSFSTDSIYHGTVRLAKHGGNVYPTFVGGEWTNIAGVDHYTPSLEMLETTHYFYDILREYAIYEPGIVIDKPSGYTDDVKPLGVFHYVGDDAFGNPIIDPYAIVRNITTNAIVRTDLDRTKPFQHSDIRFAIERQAGDPTDYVVSYYGGLAASFNVGSANDDWFEEEGWPDVDPEWEPPDPTEPGGTIIPSQKGFFGSRTVRVEFMPTPGDQGTAYINANYKGFTIQGSILVKNGLLTENAKISLEADPSSIDINQESQLTLFVTGPNGEDPGALSWLIQMYSDPGAVPPEYLLDPEAQAEGEPDAEETYGRVTISPQTGVLGVEEFEEAVSSSNKTTISMKAPVVEVISIIPAPYPDEPFEWTWNGNAELYNSEIHLDEENELPLFSTPLIVKAKLGGIGKAIAIGKEYGPVIIFAESPIGGQQAQATIQVTTATDSSLSLEADPLELDYEEESEVTCYVTPPAGHNGKVVWDVVKKGTITGQKGTLTIGNTPGEDKIEDEETGVTDLLHITTSRKIVSIQKLTLEDKPISWVDFDENVITLKDPLPYMAGPVCSYTTDGVIKGKYKGPNNDMAVYINAKLYGTNDMQSVLITTGIDCGDREIRVYSDPIEVIGWEKKGENEEAPPNAPDDHDGESPIDGKGLFFDKDFTLFMALVRNKIDHRNPEDPDNPPPETQNEYEVETNNAFFYKFEVLSGDIKLYNSTTGRVSEDGIIITKTTNRDGYASVRVKPKARKAGEAQIMCSLVKNAAGDPFACGDISETVNFTVKNYIGKPYDTYEVTIAKCTGEIDPRTKDYILVGGSIGQYRFIDRYMGLAQYCDKFGGVNERPDPDDRSHQVRIVMDLNSIWFDYWIQKVAVQSAGTFSVDPFDVDPDTGQLKNAWIDIYLTWPYVINRRELRGTVVDKVNQLQGIKNAKVEIPEYDLITYTDANGYFKFKNLESNKEYKVYIEAGNYKYNSQEAAARAGPGSVWDTNNKNDKLLVDKSTERPYLLQTMTIDIKVVATVYDYLTEHKPPPWGEDAEPEDAEEEEE